MGLDMYVNAKRYLSEYRDGDNAIMEAVNAAVPSKPGDINTIVTEAAYWRKANAIHKWFVDNVQEGKDECVEHYVSREDIRKLLDACSQVLADHTLAPTLLPSADGFFFGSTEYSEWYFGDVEKTIAQLEPLLSPDYEGWDFYYHSSW